MLWSLPYNPSWNLPTRKNIKKRHGLPEFTSSPPLGGGPNKNSEIPWNLIHSPPCGTSCRLFIHEVFFGPLGLHLRVWKELERSLPFRPMRALRLQWPRAFNLVCEVALNPWCHLWIAPPPYPPLSHLELLFLQAWKDHSSWRDETHGCSGWDKGLILFSNFRYFWQFTQYSARALQLCFEPHSRDLNQILAYFGWRVGDEL